MKYLYYPGCSLEGSGRAYDESLRAVFDRVGLAVEDLADWNCCGATAYMAVDEMKAFALGARNLALAEQMGGREPVTLIAPCSACYLVLAKVQNYMREYRRIGETISAALAAGGLDYHGTVTVRHPLDVLVNDISLETIQAQAVRPLEGYRIACYYGCQVVRPFATFDDQRDPTTMDDLLRVLGAETVDWPLKTRCCGGALTGTIEDVGVRLSYLLLREARSRGANAIATCCPLCQFNLECFQPSMGSRFGDDVNIPVGYFTQFMGQALGIDEAELGTARLFVPLTVETMAV